MTTQPNITQLRDLSVQASHSARNVHDELQDLSTDELRTVTQSQSWPFWVMALNVTGDMNIATLIRSSHLLGAQRVVVLGRRRIDRRGLVGAAHYTPVDRVWGIHDDLSFDPCVFKSFCVENLVTPVFVEQGGINTWQFDWHQCWSQATSRGHRVMLVMGEENSGIPESVLALAPELNGSCVSIPQRGVLRSHNVSMAFATVASTMIGALKWY